ncbi:MAG: hypothetical protein RIT81_22895 [Deltaproteobacteria bacterium]
MDDGQKLEALVKSLVGQPCWSAVAGDADDYALVLDFGEKHRRSLRLANPELTFLQRTYEGSHSLLVECPWRIDAPFGVAVSCFDARREDGKAKDALDQLLGREVVAVDATWPGFDLTLRLTDGWAVRVFCIEVDEKSGRKNWHCWTPGGLVVVGPRSRVELATSAEAKKAFEQLRLAPFEGFDPGDDE